jgi:hypothetical protein
MNNSGDKDIFIMAGEILKGAKQDRILKQDILVKKGTTKNTWITIPAYCVEYGRWEYNETFELSSAEKIIPSSIRKKAEIQSTQSSVWKEINLTQADFAGSNNTILKSYENKDMKNSVNNYTKAFKNIPEEQENMIGFVITSGNEIVGIEIFETNNLLREYWDKLLESYAMGDLSKTTPSITKKDIELCLSQIKETIKTKEDTPGTGKFYTFSTNSGKGTALTTYQNSLIHLKFFADNDEIPYSQTW